MKIENLSTADLIPYAKNSRTHNEAQISQIAGSIKEFGFNNPVLIDENNGIIAGHGRVMAAQQLKLKTVPCIRLLHLSELQRKAYIIADNKLALNSAWDFEMLKLELHSLDQSNYKLDLVGFDANELEKIMFGDLLRENNPDEFNGDSGNKWQLLIEYDSENELSQAFDEANMKGLKCKIIQ